MEKNYLINSKSSLSYSKYRILLFTSLAAFGQMNFAFSIGYTSYFNIIAKRKRFMSPIELEIYGSFLNLGAGLSCLLTGFVLLKYIGRKWTIFTGSIIGLLGWSMHLIFAIESISTKIHIPAYLIIARFIVGIGVGITSTSVPVYVFEISTKEMYTDTGLLQNIFIGLGFVLVYTMAYLIDEYAPSNGNLITSKILLPLPIVIVLVFSSIFATILPYSPLWMLTQKKFQDTKSNKIELNNVYLYRNSILLLDEYRQRLMNKSKHKFSYKNFIGRVPLYSTFLGLGTIFFQQFSGIKGILFNSAATLEAAGVKNGTLLTMIVGFSLLNSGILSVFISKYVKNKIVLFVSSIILTILLILFGIHNDILKKTFDIGWFAALLLALYMLVFNVSWGCLPFVYNVFIYPDNILSYISCIGIMLNWGFGFIITISYNKMVSTIGLGGVFYFYAFLMFLSIFFSYLLLPEIRLKDKNEILNRMEKNYLSTKF